MNGKVKVSDKVKRGLLIGMAMGALAMSSIACDDGGDVGNTAYEAIQNGQNTIQEAGKDAQSWVEDSGIDGPTGVQTGEGLIPALEDLINDNCD